MSKIFLGSLAVAITLELAGCGGGGGGSSNATAANGSVAILQGVAAVGAAIPNSVVSVKCLSGPDTQGTTDGNGRYTVTLSANQGLPCMLKVPSGTTGQYLHGYASAVGYANINPLTELILGKALGVDPETGFQNFGQAINSSIASRLDAAVANVIAQVNAITNLSVTSNPMNGYFAVAS